MNVAHYFLLAHDLSAVKTAAGCIVLVIRNKSSQLIKSTTIRIFKSDVIELCCGTDVNHEG